VRFRDFIIMSLASAHAASCLKLPFGYQIDLDFIKYCESLTNPDPSEVEFKRRQKRRQRQSMEVMLGIQKEMQDEMDRLSEIWEKPDTPPEPPPRSHLHFIDTPIVPTISRVPFNNQQKWDESLNEVVDDFEKTLQRSNSQRTKKRVQNGKS
jgi:KN motif and ankyrin repeat domain-containing protein